MSSFARPYARAFLEAAPADYDIERFLETGGALAAAIGQNPTLRAFLSAPAIPEHAKEKLVGALAEKAGLDEFGKRFFQVMRMNRRLLEAGEILKAVREGHDARHGIVEGRVTVATPIGPAEQRALEEALAARVGAAVRLRVDVDPRILAGFVARIGSDAFDASAVAAIRRFQKQVNEATGA